MPTHDTSRVAARTGRSPLVSRLRIAFIAGFAALATATLSVAAPAQAESAAMVLDAQSGDVLYAYNADTPHRPASLTKIMTLYLVFEAMRDGRLRPGQQLAVSRHAANQRPSRLGLSRGRTISVENAMLALITKSANDAAVVIAESLDGTERAFAKRMTARAHELGMQNTQFRNASGLHHRDQWTTARDMATLAMALIRDFPDEYHYFATESFRWRGRRYENHNALLSSYKGVDGIKTGYIRQSGFNLVASAERDQRRLVGIVLGGETSELRDWRMTRMFDYGFSRQADPDEEESEPAPMQLAYRMDGADAEALATMFAGKDVEGPPNINSSPESLESSGGTDSGAVGEQPDDAWSIQVGAYGTAAPAEEAAAEAAGHLPELSASARLAVIPVERDGTRFYRARLVGLTEAKAREACRRLSRQQIPCLAVVTAGTAVALNASR